MLFQRWLIRLCIISFAAGFTGFILTLAQSDEASTLASLFEAGCENPCFLGFEPGITTLEDIERKLQSQNIEYRFDAPMLYWYIEPQVGIVTGEASHLVMMTIIDGILIQTVFPIDTTIEAVVAVFGSPEIVSVEESGYTFAYPALGLAFIHNHLRGDPDQFSRIVNSAPYNTSSRTSHPSGKQVEQACSSYGDLPCIVPTATPTFTPTPVSTLMYQIPPSAPRVDIEQGDVLSRSLLPLDWWARHAVPLQRCVPNSRDIRSRA